jgi:hypothetical protein
MADEIPQNIVNSLNRFSRTSRLSLEDIEKLFIKELNRHKMEYVSDDFEIRCEYVLSQVEKQLFGSRRIEGRASLVLMDFQILHIYGIQDKQRYQNINGEMQTVIDRTALISGVFKTSNEAPEGSPIFPECFGLLELRDTAYEILQDVKEGGSYRLELYVKIDNRYMELKLYSYKTPKEINIKLPEPKDIITKTFSPITVNETIINLGNNRLIRGRIKHYETRFAKSSGKFWGYIDIVNIEKPKIKGKEVLRIRWHDYPNMVLKYDSPSECYFLVNIEEKEFNCITEVSAVGKAIIPIDAIPFLPDDEFEPPEDKEWI